MPCYPGTCVGTAASAKDPPFGLEGGQEAESSTPRICHLLGVLQDPRAVFTCATTRTGRNRAGV
jgi:hypothetical protein